MRDHRPMPPELHLDPDRLHTHGRRLTAVLDRLVPMPDVDPDTRTALASTDPGSRALAEFDRMAEAMDRAGRELSALTATLHQAAAAAENADSGAAGAFMALHPERS